MTMATINQLEYIKILSNYPETKNEDLRDIQEFLSRLHVSKIEELSIEGASELIQILLRRPVKYIFLCGKEKIIDKKEYNSYNTLGDLEACLHNCDCDKHNCGVLCDNVFSEFDSIPYDKCISITQYHPDVHMIRKVNCLDTDCAIEKKYGKKNWQCSNMRALCGICIGSFSFKLEEITCIICLETLSHYSDQAKELLRQRKRIKLEISNTGINRDIPPAIQGINLRTYLGGIKWKKITNKIRENANWKCQNCGIDLRDNMSKLDSHEVWLLDYDNKIAEIIDIIALCDYCHWFFHPGQYNKFRHLKKISAKEHAIIKKHWKKYPQKFQIIISYDKNITKFDEIFNSNDWTVKPFENIIKKIFPNQMSIEDAWG